MTDQRTNAVAALMDSFAERTGLTGLAPHRRYLWTDAFAVCNFIALHRTTDETRFGDQASKLVDQVHAILAPRRDPEHPAIAGLRIGKPFPERAIGEPYDANLEWDRDGQYFHYLTKWMLALEQLARHSRQPKLVVWACELAETAHRAFTVGAPGHKRMVWKMSVDLSRPQVESMGHHDPLDGFVTCLGLVATAARWLPPVKCPDLAGAIADFASMIEPRALATADPLGIGGLLIDACRLQQQLEEAPDPDHRRLLDTMLAAAEIGLRSFVAQPDLRLAADRRLGFRELGLAIGLAAVPRLGASTLERYAPLQDEITRFWLDPESRATALWREHQDINDVMLATALLPDGVLVRWPMNGSR